MDRFLQRQNIMRYRELLARTTDGSLRQQIMKLLAEEEEKEKVKEVTAASRDKD